MTRISDLEKRVAKLEKELEQLKNQSHSSGASSHASHSKTEKKHKGKNNKTKKKRPLSEFFKIMLEAKKSGAESFMYKNKKYVKGKNPKTGMIIYKKE